MFNSLINISKRVFVLCIVFSFCLGIALDQAYTHYKDSNLVIPKGDWKSIWVGQDSALQINLSLAEIDETSVTLWIREDKSVILPESFTLTIITKATIDCASRFVSIHEQRVLDQNMNVILMHENNDNPAEPTSFSTYMTLNLICGLNPTKNTHSSKNDYLYNV